MMNLLCINFVMTMGTPEVAIDKLINSQVYITKVGYYLRKYVLDELPLPFLVGG